MTDGARGTGPAHPYQSPRQQAPHTKPTESPGPLAALGERAHRSLQRRVRVLVGDSQPLYRNALARLINSWPEFDLIAAVNGEQFPDELKRSSPDVALLDPSATVPTIAQLLQTIDPKRTRLLLITADPNPEFVYQALEQGAAGFLSKDCDERAVCDAILATSRGEDVLSPGAQNA
jgi:two-component system, NarL family, nitrate/nitrite response regulator NarL